ncbi:MAG: tetratricopeptide repeat protein [Mangrovimonas sp.]|nr:tetratricopeptide repeat protein [Mangrovimonas sp.]
MGTNMNNLYLFRAMEAYPWELEKAIEALNYALSYDPENAKALCLMARVHWEQLGDYETAKSYYEKAIAANINARFIYPDYIMVLINNSDLEEAQKLIDFAGTIKGIDLASIKLQQGYLYEVQEDYEAAEKVLKQAKQLSMNNDFSFYVDDVLARIDKKRKEKNNNDRAKEREEKKEEENKETSNSWFKNRLNSLL